MSSNFRLWKSVASPLNNLRHHVSLHLSLDTLALPLDRILILVMPRLLNFIVAIYLIVIGLVGLLGAGALHLSWSLATVAATAAWKPMCEAVQTYELLSYTNISLKHQRRGHAVGQIQ